MISLEASAAALAFLFLLAVFASERLLWTAGSETIILVSGGKTADSFNVARRMVQEVMRIDHVIQGIPFLHIHWDHPSPCSIRGLPMGNPEAWWEFESPIRGSIPGASTEIIASEAWMQHKNWEIGDHVTIGSTTMTIVGSVDAGGIVEVSDTRGNITTTPLEFYFIPEKTISRIVGGLDPNASSSLAFSCHVPLKVYPYRYVDEVAAAVRDCWAGFEVMRITEPAHPSIRDPAVTSIRILEAAAVLVGIIGILHVSRNSHLLTSTLTLWLASLAFIGFLLLYSVFAPSRFAPFIPRMDLVWMIGLTLLATIALLTAHLAGNKRI